MLINEKIKIERIGCKDIYMFESHHYALSPWRKIASDANFDNVQLLTLDYHEDTTAAFFTHSHNEVGGERARSGFPVDQNKLSAMRASLISQLDRNNEDSIHNAISKLTYTEHIDAALRAKIISLAYVISFNGDGHIESNNISGKKYTMPDSNIVILKKNRGYRWLKGDYQDRLYNDYAIESDFLNERLSMIWEISNSFGVPYIEDSPYILDIDLDYFNTVKSINPDDTAAFYKLIRGALAITIARESRCVSDLRLDEKIDAPYLEQRIKEHIKAAQL